MKGPWQELTSQLLSLLSGKGHTGRIFPPHTHKVLARPRVLLCFLKRSKIQHLQLLPFEHKEAEVRGNLRL